MHILLRFLSLLVVLTVFFSGCISVANLSDLPQSNSSVNFDEAVVENNEYGRFEHIFSVNDFSKEVVFDAAKNALISERFSIETEDYTKGYIGAKRGLSANEWGMVAAVYFQDSDANTIKVKVICKITQDVTGGWTQSYAQNIANRILRVLNSGAKANDVSHK